MCTSVLEIRRGKRDNFPYYSFKTCWNPSLKQLANTVLMRGHNICFVKKKEILSSNYPQDSCLEFCSNKEDHS